MSKIHLPQKVAVRKKHNKMHHFMKNDFYVYKVAILKKSLFYNVLI